MFVRKSSRYLIWDCNVLCSKEGILAIQVIGPTLAFLLQAQNKTLQRVVSWSLSKSLLQYLSLTRQIKPEAEETKARSPRISPERLCEDMSVHFSEGIVTVTDAYNTSGFLHSCLPHYY